MSITQRLRKFLRCNLAVLIASSAIVVLPVAMQTPQRANAAVITGFTQVEGGQMFTCALKSDGTVWCWGNNTSYRLGDDTQTHSSVPVQVKGLTAPATAVRVGVEHACALLG